MEGRSSKEPVSLKQQGMSCKYSPKDWQRTLFRHGLINSFSRVHAFVQSGLPIQHPFLQSQDQDCNKYMWILVGIPYPNQLWRQPQNIYINFHIPWVQDFSPQKITRLNSLLKSLEGNLKGSGYLNEDTESTTQDTEIMGNPLKSISNAIPTCEAHGKDWKPSLDNDQVVVPVTCQVHMIHIILAISTIFMVSFDFPHFSFDSSETTGLAQRSFASFQTGFHHRLFLGDLFLQWWLAFGHLFFQWWLALWQFDLQQMMKRNKNKDMTIMQYLLDMFWLKDVEGVLSFFVACLFTWSYYEKTLTWMRCQCKKYSAKPSIHLVHWFAVAIIHKFFSFSKAILNFVFYPYHLFFHSQQSTQLLFHSTKAQHLLVDSNPFAHLSQLLLHTRQLLY